MGDDQLCIGMVVGLDYHDSSLSVHDLLQELKTHKRIRRLLEGGERVAWGAKTIPEGGYYALPESFAMPGAVLTGDSAGMVNVPKLKGVHYALRSGLLAADAIYDALKAGVDPRDPGALDAYDRAVRGTEIVRDLHRVRNQKQAFYSGLVVGSQKALLMDLTRGVYPRRAEEFDADARAECATWAAASRRRTGSSPSTSSRASSSRATPGSMRCRPAPGSPAPGG